MEQQRIGVLRFEEGESGETYPFAWGRPDEPYLLRLRTEYALDAVAAGCQADIDRVEAVCRWAHALWRHDGYHKAESDDPIAILAAAARGERFRCVEYGIVISACLNALGVPARVLSLKTEDCETREYEAGHVAAEAYARDFGKWVLADGQFGAVPRLNGVPLSALELQRALADGRSGLTVDGLSDAEVAAYFDWVGEYLVYFDVPIDNRVGVPDRSPVRLMLVPIGMKQPTVFQRKLPVKHVRYTRSVEAFYTRPSIPAMRGA